MVWQKSTPSHRWPANKKCPRTCTPPHHIPQANARYPNLTSSSRQIKSLAAFAASTVDTSIDVGGSQQYALSCSCQRLATVRLLLQIKCHSQRLPETGRGCATGTETGTEHRDRHGSVASNTQNMKSLEDSNDPYRFYRGVGNFVHYSPNQEMPEYYACDNDDPVEPDPARASFDP